jgi:hypothetical protein
MYNVLAAKNDSTIEFKSFAGMPATLPATWIDQVSFG